MHSMSVEIHRTDLACPQCHQNDQVAAVPAVCDAGTSSYAGRTDGVSFGTGIAFGGGRVASAYGVSRSVGWQTGTIQTDLAALLVPAPAPFSRTERGTCLSALALLLVPPVWAIWFLSIWVKASRRNKRIERGRPAALDVWTRALYCFRCGGVFIPEANSQGLTDEVPRDSLVQPRVFQQLVWTVGGYQDLLGITR
jgi:hypothetical protein